MYVYKKKKGLEKYLNNEFMYIQICMYIWTIFMYTLSGGDAVEEDGNGVVVFIVGFNWFSQSSKSLWRFDFCTATTIVDIINAVNATLKEIINNIPKKIKQN